MSIGTDIERIEQVITEFLANEWEAQGHHMTGKIVKELEWKVKQEVDRFILTGMIYPYGFYQATGAKWPGKMPPIEALQGWVKSRMSIGDDKESRSIAFAIAKSLKKSGMPSPGSNRFSSTGKRTDWIEEGMKKGEDKIMDAIGELSKNVLSVKIDVILKQWELSINT
jgi:hypothetical protein